MNNIFFRNLVILRVVDVSSHEGPNLSDVHWFLSLQPGHLNLGSVAFGLSLWLRFSSVC